MPNVDGGYILTLNVGSRHITWGVLVSRRSHVANLVKNNKYVKACR